VRNEEEGADERVQINWKHAVITEGERRGTQVLVAPINPSGLHQVIFATGATGWFLPEDLRINEREGI
jgi:hypothetical protein